MVKVPKFNNFFSEKGGKISINTWQKQEMPSLCDGRKGDICIETRPGMKN